MRENDRRIEAVQNAEEAVGRSVIRRRKPDVAAGVKKRYKPQIAYLFIYRKHFFVIDIKLLILGMEFDAFQPERSDAFKFFERVGSVGMDRAERDEIVGNERRGKVIDRVLLMRVGRDIHNDAYIDAVFLHLAAKPFRRPVRLRDQPAGSDGEFAHRLLRDLVGKTVRVKIYSHFRFLSLRKILSYIKAARTFIRPKTPLFGGGYGVLPSRNVDLTAVKALFENDLSDIGDLDPPRNGIFDAVYMPLQRRVHLASLESEIATFRLAILKNEPFRITERLGSDDLATDQAKPFGIPREVFAFYNAVRHRHVPAVPERVLRVEIRIRYDDVFRILKRILPLHAEIVGGYVSAHEKRIFGDERTVAYLYTAAEPAEFGRLGGAVPDNRPVAFAQRLNSVHFTVFGGYIAAVPERGTAGLRHAAVPQRTPANVPERIAQAEIAVHSLDAGRLFERGFPVGGTVKDTVFKADIFGAVQGAFLIKSLFYNGFQHLFLFRAFSVPMNILPYPREKING